MKISKQDSDFILSWIRKNSSEEDIKLLSEVEEVAQEPLLYRANIYIHGHILYISPEAFRGVLKERNKLNLPEWF